jgi:ATP adenylyltransferase
MRYIKDAEKQTGCIFCSLPQNQSDLESLIIWRGRLAFVLMNRYPYTSGHVMVAPYAHQPSIERLDADVQAEMMALISHTVTMLRAVYKPEGFNVGANIGSAAGAGFAEHVHFHIVPRWAGDTNFMSTLGEVRVLPEELETTWQRLHEAWKA